MQKKTGRPDGSRTLGPLGAVFCCCAKVAIGVGFLAKMWTTLNFNIHIYRYNIYNIYEYLSWTPSKRPETPETREYIDGMRRDNERNSQRRRRTKELAMEEDAKTTK